MNRKVLNCLGSLALITLSVEVGSQIVAANCQTQFMADIKVREAALSSLKTEENTNLFRTWRETESPPPREGLIQVNNCLSRRNLISQQTAIINSLVERQPKDVANQ